MECLELYLNKLQRDAPDSDNLFHRPIITKADNDCYFSSKQVRGINFLGNFMKNLSEKLKLKNNYTNHCIRCTTISHAKERGMSSSDICHITGHQDERSVDRYDRPSDARRRELTSVLSINSQTSNMMNQSAEFKSTNLTIQAVPEKKMKISVDGNKNIIHFDFS